MKIKLFWEQLIQGHKELENFLMSIQKLTQDIMVIRDQFEHYLKVYSGNPTFMKLYIFFTLFINNNIIEAETCQKKLETHILQESFKDQGFVNTIGILKKNIAAMIVSFLNQVGNVKVFTDSSSEMFGYQHQEF